MIEIKNIAYLLLFLPLLTSMVNSIVNYKSFSKNITFFSIVGVFAVALFLLPEVLQNGFIQNKINDSPLFLMSEYKISFRNLFFIFCLLLIKIFSMANYSKELQNTESSKNKNIVMSLYLINLFGMMGILISNNIFNIFLYMEIFSFTSYALISNYRDMKSMITAFHYFLNGVLGSVLILLSTVLIFLKFETSNIDVINKAISALQGKELIYVSLIFFVLLIGIFNKFMSFWSYIAKIKSAQNIVNFLFLNLMFVNFILGVYILMKYSIDLFGLQIIMDTIYLKYFLHIFASSIILYSSYEIFKEKKLFFIGINIFLISFCYILLFLSMKNDMSIKNIYLLIADHTLTNLGVYFIISFLLQNSSNSSIDNFTIMAKHKYVIYFIFASKILMPIMFSFDIYYNYLNEIFASRKYYLYIPFCVEKFAMINLFLRINYSFNSSDSMNEEIEKNEYNRISIYSLYFICAIIVLLTFYKL